MTGLRSFAALLRDIWSVIGARFALYLALMIVTGLLEGLTLASVVPLLSAVGVGQGGGEAGGLLGRIALSFVEAFDLKPEVTTIAAFVVGALTLSTMLFLLQAYLGARLQTNYVFLWQCRLIRLMFDAKLGFFQRRRHGELINAVVTEAQRLGGAFYQSGLLLTGIIHGIIFLAIAASLSGPITAIVLAGGAFLLLVTKPLIHRAYRIGNDISQGNADLQTMAGDFVSGIKLLKATATEGEARSRLTQIIDGLRRNNFANSFDVQIAKGIFDFGAAAMVAGILIASHVVFAVDPAVTLVVLAIFVRMMPKLTGIQQSLQSVSISLPAVRTVNEIAASAEAEAEAQGEAQLPVGFSNGPFAITLDGVTVRHGDLVTLRDVSLAIPAGSCVALVGGSGAGKSTMVDAILGLVPLNGGCIRINGKPITSLPLAELRRRLGYMTQDSVLYHGTIRDNILWGHSDAGDGAARKALRMAAASALVERLPDGLDTVVGNRGTNLSGGERQRLALARALGGQPGLLILDEATSALDAETEAAVTEALRQLKGKVTILLIAHRLSAVRLADEIHVLDGGKVVESGSWEQLQRDGSRFSRLWRLQMTSTGE